MTKQFLNISCIVTRQIIMLLIIMYYIISNIMPKCNFCNQEDVDNNYLLHLCHCDAGFIHIDCIMQIYGCFGCNKSYPIFMRKKILNMINETKCYRNEKGKLLLPSVLPYSIITIFKELEEITKRNKQKISTSRITMQHNIISLIRKRELDIAKTEEKKFWKKINIQSLNENGSKKLRFSAILDNIIKYHPVLRYVLCIYINSRNHNK